MADDITTYGPPPDDDGDDAPKMGGGWLTLNTDKVSFGVSVLITVIIFVIMILLFVYVSTGVGKVITGALAFAVLVAFVSRDVTLDKLMYPEASGSTAS